MFVNYANYKIVLEQPLLPAIILACVCLIFAILTGKIEEKNFFDAKDSLALKGVAVILLILGHYNRCISGTTILYHYAEWAVVIFLFLSGYGLSRKYGISKINRGFWKKRITRIFLPMWISIIVFLLLDFWLLGLNHIWWEVCLNFLGIHFSGAFIRINSACWFVGYILLSYLFFWCVCQLHCGVWWKFSVLFFAFCGLGWGAGFPEFKDYIGRWHHFVYMFPCGVVFGVYASRVERLSELCPKTVPFLLTVVSAFLLIRGDSFLVGYSYLQFPLLILLIILIAMVLRQTGLRSGYLMFLGTYSYEIFLLHGPLMVKYDFVLFRSPHSLFLLVYFSVIVVLAYTLSRLCSSILNGGIRNCVVLLRK